LHLTGSLTYHFHGMAVSAEDRSFSATAHAARLACIFLVLAVAASTASRTVCLPAALEHGSASLQKSHSTGKRPAVETSRAEGLLTSLPVAARLRPPVVVSVFAGHRAQLLPVSPHTTHRTRPPPRVA
jgi:hypothetical protein